MAQESSLLSINGGSILDKIEPLMKYFDAVLNNQEFPNIKEIESRVDHYILDIAIGLYRASLKYSSSMTLPKVSGLEPGLTKKIEALIASRGKDVVTLLEEVVYVTNCFFENSLAEKMPEQISKQPSNIASKPLAKQASRSSDPVKSY
jgi:hypothetical protein